MRLFFVLFLFINVQLHAEEIIEGTVKVGSETLGTFVPKRRAILQETQEMCYPLRRLSSANYR